MIPKIRIQLCVVALSVFAVTSFAPEVRADLIAYWNFNSFDPVEDTTIDADQGTGTIDLTTWTGTVGNFAGSTINVLNDDLAGASLTLAGNTGNGSF